MTINLNRPTSNAMSLERGPQSRGRGLSAEKCADLDAIRSQSSRRLGHPVGVAVGPGAQASDQWPPFPGLRRWPWSQPRGAIEAFTRVNSHGENVTHPSQCRVVNIGQTCI